MTPAQQQSRSTAFEEVFFENQPFKRKKKLMLNINIFFTKDIFTTGKVPCVSGYFLYFHPGNGDGSFKIQRKQTT